MLQIEYLLCKFNCEQKWHIVISILLIQNINPSSTGDYGKDTGDPHKSLRVDSENSSIVDPVSDNSIKVANNSDRPGILINLVLIVSQFLWA